MSRGRPLVERDVELDRQRQPRGQRLERALQAVVAEDAGCRPRAISRSSARPVSSSRERVVEQLRGAPRRRRLEPRPREPQHQRDGHEALLGAVVEVALEPPPLLVAGLHDAGARGDEVRARLRARDRQRRQLAERAEPVLGVGRQRVLARDRDRAPQRARDDDRRRRGRAVAACGTSPPRSRPSSPPQSSTRAGAGGTRARAPSAESSSAADPLAEAEDVDVVAVVAADDVAVPSPS